MTETRSVHLAIGEDSRGMVVPLCESRGAKDLVANPGNVTCIRCLKDPLFWSIRQTRALEDIAAQLAHGQARR